MAAQTHMILSPLQSSAIIWTAFAVRYAWWKRRQISAVFRMLSGSGAEVERVPTQVRGRAEWALRFGSALLMAVLVVWPVYDWWQG